MSAVQVIEIAIGAGAVGGFIKGIAALTRLTVAVEAAAEKIAALVERQERTEATVQAHEVRLGKGGL